MLFDGCSTEVLKYVAVAACLCVSVKLNYSRVFIFHIDMNHLSVTKKVSVPRHQSISLKWKMTPLIFVKETKMSMLRIPYTNPVCYLTAWPPSSFQTNHLHWYCLLLQLSQKITIYKVIFLHTHAVRTSTMAAWTVCYITWKPKWVQWVEWHSWSLVNPLLSLSELSLTQFDSVSVDFTDSPGSWQEALWESMVGRKGLLF